MAETRDINSAFLEFVVTGDARDPGVPGVSPELIRLLEQLDRRAIARIAATPILLPELVVHRAHRPECVNDSNERDVVTSDVAYGVTIMILTWVHQNLRYRPLQTRVVAGLDDVAADAISSCACRDLASLVQGRRVSVTARFAPPSPFWPRVIRAARSDSPADLERAWLSAVQLGWSEITRQRSGRGKSRINSLESLPSAQTLISR